MPYALCPVVPHLSDKGYKSGFALSKYCAIWVKELDFGDKLGKGTTSQCRKSMGFALALL